MRRRLELWLSKPRTYRRRARKFAGELYMQSQTPFWAGRCINTARQLMRHASAGRGGSKAVAMTCMDDVDSRTHVPAKCDPVRHRAIAYDEIRDGEELSYLPLEGYPIHISRRAPTPALPQAGEGARCRRGSRSYQRRSQEHSRWYARPRSAHCAPPLPLAGALVARWSTGSPLVAQGNISYVEELS